MSGMRFRKGFPGLFTSRLVGRANKNVMRNLIMRNASRLVSSPAFFRLFLSSQPVISAIEFHHLISDLSFSSPSLNGRSSHSAIGFSGRTSRYTGFVSFLFALVSSAIGSSRLTSRNLCPSHSRLILSHQKSDFSSDVSENKFVSSSSNLVLSAVETFRVSSRWNSYGS